MAGQLNINYSSYHLVTFLAKKFLYTLSQYLHRNDELMMAVLQPISAQYSSKKN